MLNDCYLENELDYKSLVFNAATINNETNIGPDTILRYRNDRVFYKDCSIIQGPFHEDQGRYRRLCKRAENRQKIRRDR